MEPQEAELFFKLHSSVLCFANQKLKVVRGVESPAALRGAPSKRLSIREPLAGRLDLIDAFVDQNPFGLAPDELAEVASWRDLVWGRFFVFRHQRRYTVFLATEPQPVAYGVVGLTDELSDLLHQPLPVWAETMLLPFRGRIVYDGLLSGFNITFGPGIRRSLADDYRTAKERQGIVTSLPAGAAAPAPLRRRSTRAAPAVDPRMAADHIRALVDDFCRTALNDEYAEICQRLVDRLARKRPSPLTRGSPNAWASGVVRTIGWANYLTDSSSVPCLKMAEIDAHFGVSESTGQAKSATIRKLLRLSQADAEWILPSQLDSSPFVWMIEVSGFIVDARSLPRPLQEAALAKGLIPHLPPPRVT